MKKSKNKNYIMIIFKILFNIIIFLFYECLNKGIIIKIYLFNREPFKKQKMLFFINW